MLGTKVCHRCGQFAAFPVASETRTVVFGPKFSAGPGRSRHLLARTSRFVHSALQRSRL